MQSSGIEFHRPFTFWFGAALITGGVVAHLPDFVAAADNGYRMADMLLGPLMITGMAAIAVGLMLAGWALVPPRTTESPSGSLVYELKAIDDARLTGAHWGLLLVLGVALVIDVMKPATLGFVLPGMSEEYGLTASRAAWLLIAALAGTTIGSVVWGVMADRIGRRAAILMASLMFIGTAICGTMPRFDLNLAMCFFMGLTAGGMLPIVYALMTESVPARPRGWLVVLHGGMGNVGGTLAAAGCAVLLEPEYSWRALWLMNLPTGILMLVLNRWIPESPRYLLDRVDEARAVMLRYGVTLTARPAGSGPPVTAACSHWMGVGSIFVAPYRTQTVVVFVYGLAWGIVNWGFLSFLPTFLRNTGFGVEVSSFLLFLSSVVAIPGTVLVAYSYGRWSSRRSMVAFALASIAAILALAWLAPTVSSSRATLVALLAMLYAATGGVIAMLSPYTAEVYPTRLRGTGSGLGASASKLGGLVGGIATATGITGVTAGMTQPAVLVSIPMIIAALLVAAKGIETRGRRLEELAAHEWEPSRARAR